LIRIKAERRVDQTTQFYGSASLVPHFLANASITGNRALAANAEGARARSSGEDASIGRKDCEVLAESTPEAIAEFNHAKKHKIGLFHVTC